MISGETRVFAVIGRPVSHSLSPALHNRWLAAHGVDAVYVALEVRSAAAVPQVVQESGLAGVNLTAPYKGAAGQVADEWTAAARAVGAVNTLFRSKGRWIADNTDVEGFRVALGHKPAGPVVVLGAGGSARAVAFVLREFGVDDLTILARTASRAEILADTFGGRSGGLDGATLTTAAERAALIVNCTAGGAAASLRASIAELAVAPDRWFDLNYWDPVIAGAEASGLRMLGSQAAAAFERFTGIALEPAEVDDAVRLAVPRGASAC